MATAAQQNWFIFFSRGRAVHCKVIADPAQIAFASAEKGRGLGFSIAQATTKIENFFSTCTAPLHPQVLHALHASETKTALPDTGSAVFLRNLKM